MSLSSKDPTESIETFVYDSSVCLPAFFNFAAIYDKSVIDGCNYIDLWKVNLRIKNLDLGDKLITAALEYDNPYSFPQDKKGVTQYYPRLNNSYYYELELTEYRNQSITKKYTLHKFMFRANCT